LVKPNFSTFALKLSVLDVVFSRVVVTTQPDFLTSADQHGTSTWPSCYQPTFSQQHRYLAMADQKSQAALFQVYLRLRPPPTNQQIATERFLSVEEPATADDLPTHITLNPPNDNRRRAVEKFAFTTVFEEEATQLDLFHGTGVLPLVEGVLGPQGGEGRDGLLATLGVTGSGKVHSCRPPV
jgi:hypothetical protein